MAQEKKTRANGRASREAILSAALEVFAERGHRGTSLSEIASRVGMTQPGLMHHFGTKDELLLEVVRSREERTGPDVGEHLSAERFEIREAILALASINEAAAVEQLLLTTLSAEAIPPGHPLHAHFVARYRDARNGLTAAIAREQAEGRVRADLDPPQLAREIVATLDGLRLQWLLDPKEVDLKQVLGSYADRLETELAPPRHRGPQSSSPAGR